MLGISGSGVQAACAGIAIREKHITRDSSIAVNFFIVNNHPFLCYLKPGTRYPMCAVLRLCQGYLQQLKKMLYRRLPERQPVPSAPGNCKKLSRFCCDQAACSRRGQSFRQINFLKPYNQTKGRGLYPGLSPSLRFVSAVFFCEPENWRSRKPVWAVWHFPGVMAKFRRVQRESVRTIRY